MAASFSSSLLELSQHGILTQQLPAAMIKSRRKMLKPKLKEFITERDDCSRIENM